MTDKGVDGCVEVLGVPKEKRMLVSSKMRNQHRHHSVAKRRKPVMLDPDHRNILHNLALHTGTLVERDEERVSTTFPWTLWNFTVQSLLAVTRL